MKFNSRLDYVMSNSNIVCFTDSQDVDLDAILGELCALERRCDGDIASTPAPDTQRTGRPNSGRINTGDNNDIGKTDGGIIVFVFIIYNAASSLYFA